jgi:hypothetical protein
VVARAHTLTALIAAIYLTLRRPAMPKNGDCAGNLRFLLAVYALASPLRIPKTSDYDTPFASYNQARAGWTEAGSQQTWAAKGSAYGEQCD